MKKYLYILSGSILLFSACEKVIDLQLDSTDTKIVITGTVTDQTGPSVVTITQTKDFNLDNTFPGVAGATVSITDNDGPETSLKEIATGRYESDAINGQPGHTYALKVVVNGTTYTASSTMPAVVRFDSLYISKEVLMGDDRTVANVMYVDPPEKGNAFHYVQYINNRRTRFLFAENDNLNNGRKITTQLRVYGEEGDNQLIKAGDSVKVEMEGIDSQVYKYWFSLQSASGGSNNGAPANPVTNIKGGALGYFSAHSIQIKTAVVRE